MATLILRGAALLDPPDPAPVNGRAVVIRDGWIEAVVPDHEAPAGTTLRLDGLTLLPGLVNAHVHFALGAEPNPVAVMLGEPLATTVVKMLVRARETVEAGVTTVRDLGGRDYAELAVRDAIRVGLVPGPRVLAAGKIICMTGGHGHWAGREADGPVDMRRAVREQIKAGADLVKLIATGGVLTPGVEPGAPQLEPDEMAAAVAEARKAGRRTAAHAMAASGIAAAVAAGITTIEHGVFLTEAICERMARERVFLVPTLAAPERIAVGGIAAGIPEFMVRKSNAVIERHIESVRLAHRMGVPIVAGSDAGTPLNPHGSLLPELALLVRAGLSPIEAIRAATTTAAEALGLADTIGRVAPGFAADLLAVPGDPTVRIDAIGDPRLVMVEGKVLVHRI
ncbi:MAG TPA: amidohydrolase family protein [Thermodesulfobacteriota bacterium]